MKKTLSISILILYSASILAYCVMDVTHQVLHRIQNSFHHHSVSHHKHTLNDHDHALKNTHHHDHEAPKPTPKLLYFFAYLDAMDFYDFKIDSKHAQRFAFIKSCFKEINLTIFDPPPWG